MTLKFCVLTYHIKKLPPFSALFMIHQFSQDFELGNLIRRNLRIIDVIAEENKEWMYRLMYQY